MEALIKSLKNDNLVLLGLEVWEASETQVKKFINTTGITHPALLQAHTVMSDYKVADRNNFVVINGEGKIAYNSSLDVPGYSKGWRPEEVTPVLEKELKKLTSSVFDGPFVSGRFSVVFDGQIIPVRLNLENSQPGNLPAFSVFDIQGRFVTEISPVAISAHKLDFQWRGASIDGNIVPPGVYLVRLKGFKSRFPVIWTGI